MQINRVPVPDVAERSPFHSAFSQARGESRSVDVEMIRSKAPASMEPERLTYEVRIEKRSGKRSVDAGRWNKLGQQGWELVSVVGKHAYFRRIATDLR
jgi:hypothetical protein